MIKVFAVYSLKIAFKSILLLREQSVNMRNGCCCFTLPIDEKICTNYSPFHLVLYRESFAIRF